jgi:hypothetical protein
MLGGLLEIELARRPEADDPDRQGHDRHRDHPSPRRHLGTPGGEVEARQSEHGHASPEEEADEKSLL